jgi:hypothetical protein
MSNDSNYSNNNSNSNETKNFFESLIPSKTLEEKMLKYSKELEEKYRTDLEREISHIKEVNFSEIRIEENKKYMKKLEEIRNEYEEEYSKKYEHLRKRESDLAIKFSNKEKEIEINNYEIRQKYLNQIEVLKLKQEELKLKYENDLNLLNMQKEKISLKENELNDLREKSTKINYEDMENFKSNYTKNFEKEKSEFNKCKLILEENEYKAKINKEEIQNLQNSNKNFIEENKLYKEDIKKLENENREYQKDLFSLKEEIKKLTNNAKFNNDDNNIKLNNYEKLKTENQILKENIYSLKIINEDLKSDQGIIIKDLKNQIQENTKHFNKIKEDLEDENIKLRKEINQYELNKCKKNDRDFHRDKEILSK